MRSFFEIRNGSKNDFVKVPTSNSPNTKSCLTINKVIPTWTLKQTMICLHLPLQSVSLQLGLT